MEKQNLREPRLRIHGSVPRLDSTRSIPNSPGKKAEKSTFLYRMVVSACLIFAFESELKRVTCKFLCVSEKKSRHRTYVSINNIGFCRILKKKGEKNMMDGKWDFVVIEFCEPRVWCFRAFLQSYYIRYLCILCTCSL